MPDLVAAGVVVEERPGALIIRPRPGVEEMHEVLENDARPGDHVEILSDGDVLVTKRALVEPVILVPGHPNLRAERGADDI